MNKQSITSIIIGIISLLISSFSFVMIRLSFFNIYENFSNNTFLNAVIWSAIAIVFGVVGTSLLYRRIYLIMIFGACLILCCSPPLIYSIISLTGTNTNSTNADLNYWMITIFGNISILLGVGLVLSLVVAFLVKFLHKNDPINPATVFPKKKMSND